MSSEYIKQLEEANEYLKQKLNTIFDWRVVDTPYGDEYDKNSQSFFMVRHECYIHGELYAMVGDNLRHGGYKGICKGTTTFDHNLDVVKKSIEQTYMMQFYIKVRI